LDKLGRRPEKFAKFKNLGRHGSSHSEQNHSSIVAAVGPDSMAELHESVKYFLDRQNFIINKRNQELMECI